MPLFESLPVPRQAPRVRASGSLAIELEWAMCAAVRTDWRADSLSLTAAYESDPGLEEELRGLWGPEDAISCGGFMELAIVAEQGGVLLSEDEHRLLDHLEELCAEAPTAFDEVYPAMLCEEESDRLAVLRRLRRLHQSAEFRSRYAVAVRRTWEAVRGDWERYGRHAVAHAVAHRRHLAAQGADWHEVTRGDCDHGDLLAQCVERQGPGTEVVVVPAYYTHLGLLIDLPGKVVVGVRPDMTAVDARVRTEAIARRLKALSDPTRLAILDALHRSPRSVTELAGLFGLSQPTVSNHVKLLRDVGLVADRRDGARRRLVVQTDEAADLLVGLGEVLAPARPDGEDDVDEAVEAGTA